jgi:hypothetical protein
MTDDVRSGRSKIVTHVKVKKQIDQSIQENTRISTDETVSETSINQLRKEAVQD